MPFVAEPNLWLQVFIIFLFVLLQETPSVDKIKFVSHKTGLIHIVLVRYFITSVPVLCVWVFSASACGRLCGSGFAIK